MGFGYRSGPIRNIISSVMHQVVIFATFISSFLQPRHRGSRSWLKSALPLLLGHRAGACVCSGECERVCIKLLRWDGTSHGT